MTGILLFFSIGASELFLIALVIIIFFGSKKIPEFMRGLGKGIREFKNATAEIQREITREVRAAERDITEEPKPAAGEEDKKQS